VNFWQIVMLMFWFFLFALWVWILTAMFIDVFRRSDVSGWGKAGWAVLVFVLPVIGVLAYLITRPHLTPGERHDVAAYEEVIRPGTSAVADEIATLAKLRSNGAISDAEYEDLKARAIER